MNPPSIVLLVEGNIKSVPSLPSVPIVRFVSFNVSSKVIKVGVLFLQVIKEERRSLRICPSIHAKIVDV